MAVLQDPKRVRAHFAEVKKTGTGLENRTDIRETLEKDIERFAKELSMTRRGEIENSKGMRVAPIDMSLPEALRLNYGCDVNTYLLHLGINPKGDTFHRVAKAFGMDSLNTTGLESLLINHSSFSYSSPNNTTGINSDYRFIIPELFLNAIRLGYQHTAQHQNWIAGVQNLSQEEITMPQILRGDGMPSKIHEGADMPVGSLAFGKKRAKVFKVGTGFNITDELLMASSLDMVFTFLQEVGNDMSIAADVLAINILVNGEQGDGSESAPVVGVNNTSTGFTYKDFKRVFTRMARLGLTSTRVIGGEDDTIDVTEIDRFQGFNGTRSLADIRTIVGVPDQFQMDTFPLPAGQVMFLNAARAMVKLLYRGLMVERRRNPRNQTEELFVSDWLNFAIVKRDARVLLDKDIAYSGNGFPAYMDIDARIQEGFRSL